MTEGSAVARMPDFDPPEPEPEPAPESEPAPAPSADEMVDATPAEAQSQPLLDAPSDAPQRLDLRALWRRIRVPAIAFATGIAVAVAGSIVAGVVQERTRHDDVVAAIDAYVAAIESDGDRVAATGVSPVLDDAVASSRLLESSIAVAEAPDVVCDEPRVGVGLARVDCRVRVAGRIEPATMTLEHDAFRWLVVRGLEVPVRIQSGALLVDAVGGVPLDDDVSRGERAVWLLPGRYDVAAHAPVQLAVQVDGLVVSPSGGAVRWEGDTAATVDADVRAAALAFVDACAAAPTDGCPAIQDRDPVEPFEAFAVVGRIALDDRYAMTYDVSVRRPIEQPSEFLLITVRVDFGEDLDRYDIAVVPS